MSDLTMIYVNIWVVNSQAVVIDCHDINENWIYDYFN